MLQVPPQDPASHTDPGPGDCLGRYRIERLLASGGMGEVYLAKDSKLDRDVAVKVLSTKIKVGAPAFDRFVQEAKAASALNHPNILVVHEIADETDVPYIVSEFVNGRTLTEIIQSDGLTTQTVVGVAIQIASALAAAHEAGIIHRDVKPDNIMVRRDGIAKVLDFGLAKLIKKPPHREGELSLEHRITGQGRVIGTVNYMSPEQARGRDVDPRTDVFSLGSVIYEMITRIAPFAGESTSDTIANLVCRDPAPVNRFAADVPFELQRIVSKMLRKDLKERYQSMDEVLSDLKDLETSLRYEQKLGPVIRARGGPDGEALNRADETPTLELKLFTEEESSYPLAAKLVIYLIAAAVLAALLSSFWNR